MADFELLATESASDLTVYDEVIEPTPPQNEIQNLIPKFDYLFDDSILSNTALEHRVQIRRVSDTFLVWDTDQVVLGLSVTKGQRVSKFQYGYVVGLTLWPLEDDTEYEWRVKIWDDNGHQGEWSSYEQFRCLLIPAAPYDLRLNGETDPMDIVLAQPTFTFKPQDPNVTGEYHSHFQLQVDNLDGLFTLSVNIIWDSGKETGSPYDQNDPFKVEFRSRGLWKDPEAPSYPLNDPEVDGTVVEIPITATPNANIVDSPKVKYGHIWINPGEWEFNVVGSDPVDGKHSAKMPSALSQETQYWWRVRSWDDEGNVSPWSSVATFYMLDFTPQVNIVYTGKFENSVWVTNGVPVFSFLCNLPDINATIVSCTIEVNSRSNFDSSTSIWNHTVDLTEDRFGLGVNGLGSGILSPDIYYGDGEFPFRYPEEDFEGITELQPATKYFWRIKITDINGTESLWSNEILPDHTYFWTAIQGKEATDYIPINLR